jgi:asparagine synthase (glutamine-hydrolysing)
MEYEDFYASGTYVNDELGLWLGWVNHKKSFSDCLPIWNGARDICLIFVGEHFADASEVTRLQAAGHSIGPGAQRASYLVHLYEERGSDFLAELNGPFNGVLIDLRRKEAVLFNDRYGLARLYYCEDERGLYFASEAKSLLKVLPRARAMDNRGLAEYLSLGCVMQNRTLFKDIFLLPPGSAWRFAGGSQIKRETYFDPTLWEQQEPIDTKEYPERLREVWTRILPRYLSGTQKVGLSMTGGLDSRMILGWAHAEPDSLPCYTFGGPYRECADVQLARRAAAICHQPHQVLLVGEQFLADFPAIVEKSVYVSDGAMDASGSIDVYAQMLARRVAPVRLSGVNGGEILRGLVAFKPQRLSSRIYDRELLRQSLVAEQTYQSERAGDKLCFIAFKQAPWFMSAKFAIEFSQITFRTPYFDNELVKLAYRVPNELAGSTTPALRLIAEGNPALEALGTDRGIAFRAVPGLMHLRHLFQQFTFKAEYAFDYGMPQWLAQVNHVMSPLHLESLFLGRHKFHHFRTYYRDALSGYVREVLLDPRSRSRPHVNGDFLETMVNDHARGRRNYTTEIHKLLSVELAYRGLIEQGFQGRRAS